LKKKGKGGFYRQNKKEYIKSKNKQKNVFILLKVIEVEKKANLLKESFKNFYKQVMFMIEELTKEL